MVGKTTAFPNALIQPRLGILTTRFSSVAKDPTPSCKSRGHLRIVSYLRAHLWRRGGDGGGGADIRAERGPLKPADGGRTPTPTAAPLTSKRISSQILSKTPGANSDPSIPPEKPIFGGAGAA